MEGAGHRVHHGTRWPTPEEPLHFETVKGPVAGATPGRGRRSRRSWSRTAPAPGWIIRSWSGSPARERGGHRDPAVQLPLHRERQTLAGYRGGPPRRLAGGLRAARDARDRRPSRCGRVASRSAAGSPRWARPTADPPGRPRLPRLSLASAGQAGAHPRRAPVSVEVPMLFLQGTSDPFAITGSPAAGRGEAGRPRHARPVRGGEATPSRCAAGSAIRARSAPRSPRPSRRSSGMPTNLMPRKNRRDPELFQPQEAPRPRSARPVWAGLPGYDIRHVGGEKEYRCPGAITSCAPASGISWSSRSTLPRSADTGTRSAGGRSSAGSAPIGPAWRALKRFEVAGWTPALPYLAATLPGVRQRSRGRQRRAAISSVTRSSREESGSRLEAMVSHSRRRRTASSSRCRSPRRRPAATGSSRLVLS